MRLCQPFPVALKAARMSRSKRTVCDSLTPLPSLRPGFLASISFDSGIPVCPPNPTEFTLGHNVSSKEEVDAVMAQAENAGAKIVKKAQDTFWGGYAGYFQDPDGHLWEIAWNLQLQVNEQA